MQTSVDIEALNQQILADSAFIDQLKAESAKVIVGQDIMIERLLSIIISCITHTILSVMELYS